MSYPVNLYVDRHPERRNGLNGLRVTVSFDKDDLQMGGWFWQQTYKKTVYHRVSLLRHVALEVEDDDRINALIREKVTELVFDGKVRNITDELREAEKGDPA